MGTRYPREGSVLALLDTGFNGFLMAPGDVYSKLKLNELIPEKIDIKGVCCGLSGYKYPIRVLVPDLNLSIDGELIYFEGNEELILGMEFLSHVKLIINGCNMIGRINLC